MVLSSDIIRGCRSEGMIQTAMGWGGRGMSSVDRFRGWKGWYTTIYNTCTVLLSLTGMVVCWVIILANANATQHNTSLLTTHLHTTLHGFRACPSFIPVTRNKLYSKQFRSCLIHSPTGWMWRETKGLQCLKPASIYAYISAVWIKLINRTTVYLPLMSISMIRWLWSLSLCRHAWHWKALVSSIYLMRQILVMLQPIVEPYTAVVWVYAAALTLNLSQPLLWPKPLLSISSMQLRHMDGQTDRRTDG